MRLSPKTTILFSSTVLFLFFLVGCADQPSTSITVVAPSSNLSIVQESISPDQEDPVQDVTFTTVDGVKIAATYYIGTGSKGVVLVHMLNTDKSVWKELAFALQDKGFHVLAIDLRGHGESDLDWQSFSIQDWKKGVNDIKRAVKFLVDKGLNTTSISLIGASIGANLALMYASEENDLQKVALLSPGLDYRGVEIEGPNKKYDHTILYAVAVSDSYSYDSVRQLYEESSAEKTLKIYAGKEHGTDLFIPYPELINELIIFLE